MFPAPPATPSSTQGPILRDIHLPADPSWWPPAPGWWLLAALLLLALLATGWLWRRNRRAIHRRQRVLAELEQLADRHRRDGDHAVLASGLHQLVRRVARCHDVAAAQQRGEVWRQTLARMPVDASTLNQLLALEQAMYQSRSTFDAIAALTAVRQWLLFALKPSAWKSAATVNADA